MATKKSAAPTPAKLLSLALGDKGTIKSRCNAMASLGNIALVDRETFRSVTGVVRDAAAPAELRRAALSTLKAAAFDTLAFAPYQSAYLATMRALRSDADLDIRQTALGVLARAKDGDTQALLLKGLDDPESALVAPEKALQLLGYDAHAGAFDAARKIAKKPPNPLAKHEALRVLATDAKSAKMFEKLLLDKKEDLAFRQIAASALHQLAPKRLQSCARDIAMDKLDSADMNALGLTALTHFGDPAALSIDRRLKSHVDALSKQDATSGHVLKAAQEFSRQYGK
jgi:hypothetical protein